MRIYFNRQNARKQINQFLSDVADLVGIRSSTDISVDVAKLILSKAEDLINNTNLSSYDYERAILYKYYDGMNAMIVQSQQTQVLPKQIHYMNDNDQLFVMANEYYGNPDMLLDIMSQNGIYSTDDALVKRVLMVDRREG